jgi:hypothetical protein
MAAATPERIKTRVGLLAVVPRLGLLLAAAVIAGQLGCETARPQEPRWTRVDVTDVSSIEGKWEGLLRRTRPGSRREDWVTLVIAPSGKYRFASVRTIGVLSGEGQLSADHGLMTGSSDRQSVQLALYEAGGRRLLRFENRWANGEEYLADLTPKEQGK